MSWEPDTEENRLGRVRKELEDLKASTSFLNTPINDGTSSNALGVGFGVSSFNQGANGDIPQQIVNNVQQYGSSWWGFVESVASFMVITPSSQNEPFPNQSTIKKINGGVDGQKTVLKPATGTTIRLLDNPNTNLSTEGDLLIGSDLVLTDTESVTLRFTTDVLYSDSYENNDPTKTEIQKIGGWIIESTSSGSGNSTNGILKDPVKVSSTGNNSLHPVWGATIDGIGMVAGDRFLVKDQTTQADNGIYIWAVLGSTRSSDMSHGSVQKEGTMTYTQDGNTQAEILYAINIGGNNITIGTNANTWGEIGSGSSGGGSGTIKSPCKYATTANITLSGEQSIDGTATSTSRVLVKNQTTASQNGIYVTASSAWARSTDMATASTIEGGTMVYVTDGTVNGDNLFGLTTEGTVIVGTTNQAWANLTAGGSWVGTASSSLNMVTFPIYGQWDIGGGQTNFVNTDPTVGIQADLDMNTYDIKDVCRIGFELGGTAIQNTISGISTTLIPSTTNYSMHFNVPDNSEFKFTTYGRNRFRVTDSETKIYTENGGATYERLTVDNLDMWVHNIDLSPTTNSQDLGGDGSGSAPVQEQWRYVYGNNFKIINQTSNITTTTEGGVFMNATNGLTLKSYDLGSTNFGSTTFTDKDGVNRVEFNYDMSATDGNAVFNYMRKGFKIRSNASDGEALLIYPRQNSFATNDVIMDVIDPSANGALSIKLNSFERIRLDMTNTTIKAQTASGQVQVNSKIYMNGSTDAEKEISAGNVVPRSYGYTLGASGTGLLEKGWGSLYLTTEGTNADKGKITLNDHGATYMKFDESTGISLVTDDALSFTSASSVTWNITASTGMNLVIGGATTHQFTDNALSLGSGVDLVVSGNLLDFTNRATPTAGSIFGDGAIYSKSVSGVDTPMWWDGTTETSMLGGGSSSGGGVNASYIWTNDETNEYDQMVYLSNATMGSSSGMNNVNARLIKDNIYYIPIYFSKACTIDEIGYECTISGGSSVQLRFGLYSNRTDNQNYPYQLIDGGSDLIYLSATTGASRYPLGFGKTLSVPSAGLFWVAINNTNNTSTTFRIEGGDVGGVNTVGHVYNTTANPDKFEPIQAFKESDSGNMPSTADDDNQSIGFGDTGNRAPVIFLRVS